MRVYLLLVVKFGLLLREICSGEHPMPVLVQKVFQVRNIALDVMAWACPEWTKRSNEFDFASLFNDLSFCQKCALTLFNYERSARRIMRPRAFAPSRVPPFH